MSRRRRHAGPTTWYSHAFAPPLERQLYPFYSQYGLPIPALLQVALPSSISIEAVATFKKKICGDFFQLKEEVEDALRKLIDAELEKKKKPKTDPLKHLFFDIALGPQIVHHTPFRPSQQQVGAEVDAVLQADVNFVFHDEEHSGLEVSLALQGSGNYFFVDPNQNNPNETSAGQFAGQGQVQLQVGYFFPNFLGVKKLTFSGFLQAAGSATYQYDPNQRSPQWGYSAIGAAGLGLSYDVTDKITLGAQFWEGINSNNGSPTRDFGSFFTITFHHDLLK